MSDTPSTGRWLFILAMVALTITLVTLALAFVMQGVALVLLAVGKGGTDSAMVLVVRMLALAGGGAVAMLLYGLLDNLLQGGRERQTLTDRLNRIESLLQAMHESNRRAVDLSQMSDSAKSLLFRQREIEAMNELLHDYLINQQYDLAEGLADDIEKRFGYVEQVKRMRADIAAARSSTSDQKIDGAVERVRKYLGDHEWFIAGRMAHRLAQSLPDNTKIQALPEMIREAQAKHKRELLKTYGEAVKTGNLDRSIEMLHELDKYLSPQEAAAMEESARGVFRAKLHNLGVQFAIRVTEEQWAEALTIGQQIVDEYPNSRMAQEVRMKLETLQSLAANKAPAQA